MLEQEVMLAGRRLKNPFVYLPMGLGAMTLEQRLAHYEAVARGGVGLMIMEAVQVSAEPARRYPVMPGLSAQSMALGLYTDADEAWLAQVAERGQAQGAGRAADRQTAVRLASRGNDADTAGFCPGGPTGAESRPGWSGAARGARAPALAGAGASGQ